MAGERVSQAEFARRNGWSKQYVAKLVKQGRIKLEGGKIDPVAAKRAIDQLAEPSTALRDKPVQGRTPIPASTAPTDSRKAVDYASARTMREAYKAKMAKLDYEEREKQLVDARKVREEAFQTGRLVRDALLGIPDRMADILAAENDPSQVRIKLYNEIEAALQSLSESTGA